MNRPTHKITQQDNTRQEKIKRRSFLKGAAVAGTTMGTGVLTSQALSESVVEQVKLAANTGYRETDHIREYYRLARF